MDFIHQLLLPPTAEHYGMIIHLIFFMLFLHLPFAGAMLMGAGLTLALDRTRPELAGAMRRWIPRTAGPWLLAGLLPPVCLMFLYGQMLYRVPCPISDYLLGDFFLITGGLFLLFIYRRLQTAIIGLLGLLLTAAAYFFFMATLSLIAAPDAWNFIPTPLPHIFSVTVVIRFLIFLAASTGLAGAVTLFFLFIWEETRLPADSPLRAVILPRAAGAVLGSSLILAPLLIWDFYTVSETVLTTPAFVAGGAILAVLLALAWCGLAILTRGRTGRAVPALLLALLLFGLLAYKDRNLQAGANREYMVLLAAEAVKTRDALTASREALNAKNVQAGTALGQKIYNERCSACHRFDQRLVGPPYDDVVPKYKGKLEELKAFVRNPVKVNPAYPPMPNQGLSEPEIASVAAFLMERAGGK